MGPAAYAGSVA